MDKKSKGNYAIAAPAGIGKTHIILKHVATEATKKFVEIYVQRHQLATEVRAKLLEFNPNLKVVVIRGRTHVDKNVVGAIAPCKKSDLIKSIESYGYNIYKDVCLDCEFFRGVNSVIIEAILMMKHKCEFLHMHIAIKSCSG